jgi:hypothetical protein
MIEWLIYTITTHKHMHENSDIHASKTTHSITTVTVDFDVQVRHDHSARHFLPLAL